MRPKHTIALIFFALLALILTACGDIPAAVTDSATAESTASAEPFVCPHTEINENGQCLKCLNYFGKLGDNIDWTFTWSDCALTLTGSGDMSAPFSNDAVRKRARKIVIGEGITSIAERAFCDFSHVTAVQLPEGITSIGEDAFYCCTALTEIKLPSSLRTVGSSAFYMVPLTELELPEGITNIEDLAFAYTKLTALHLPSSLRTVGDMAFYCAPLTELELPEGITDIGDDAFAGASFAEIYIPANVTTLESYALQSNALLRYTVSPDNPVYSADADGVLFDKSGKTLVAFPCGREGHYAVPEGVERIGESAFYGCGLSSVTLPSSLTEIGEDAFAYCMSLADIRFGGNVTQCSWNSFERTPWWDAQAKLSAENGDGIYVDKVLLHFYHANEVFTVREGTVRIAALASIHSDSEAMKTLVLPDSLRYIDDAAFCLCPNLENVILPEGLLTIGHAAFADITALTEVRIPKSVTSVSTEAFRGCPALTRVVFDSTDCEIGQWAFLYDDKVTLYGAADSTAARYAAENEIPFAEIK